MILGQVPGRLGIKLTTHFELVHNTKPDSKTWFELFSIGYFNHTVDNTEIRSKFQSHTLDGIDVDRYYKSNAIIFYNPLTSSYYRLPNVCLDESRLPITNFLNYLRFYGCLACGLLLNITYPIHEPFPPGTCVSIQHNGSLVRGTINNIPLPVSPIIQSDSLLPSNTSDDSSQSSDIPDSSTYVIVLDSGITVKKSYDNLIKLGRNDVSTSQSSENSTTLEVIPDFLPHESKVTMYCKGGFHKVYIHFSPKLWFQFAVRHNLCSRKIYFTILIPDFKQNWTTLVVDAILFYVHSIVGSSLKSSMTSKNALLLDYVSAKNILSPCPPSLLKTLYPSNPDCQLWLDSYNEDKQGIINHGVCKKILKTKYLALKR